MSNYVFELFLNTITTKIINCEKAHILTPLVNGPEYKAFSTISMAADPQEIGSQSTGYIRVEGTDYPTSGRDITTFTRPYTHYQYFGDGKSTIDSLWCHIDFRLNPYIDFLAYFDTPTIIPEEQTRRLRPLLRTLSRGKYSTYKDGVWKTEYFGDTPTCLDAVRQYRISLEILEIILELSTPKPEFALFCSGYSQFLPVMKRIYSNFSLTPTLDELADIAQCSRSAFEKKFKNVMNISPGQCILRARMEQACKLLLSMNVNQTAAELGFSDSYAFSKFFRKAFDISPGEYRRRHSVNYQPRRNP